MATFDSQPGMVECDYCLAFVPVDAACGCDECESDFCTSCWLKYGKAHSGPDGESCNGEPNWEDDMPVVLYCPSGYETATIWFDPAGYDPLICAGCGCSKNRHWLNGGKETDHYIKEKWRPLFGSEIVNLSMDQVRPKGAADWEWEDGQEVVFAHGTKVVDHPRFEFRRYIGIAAPPAPAPPEKQELMENALPPKRRSTMSILHEAHRNLSKSRWQLLKERIGRWFGRGE